MATQMIPTHTGLPGWSVSQEHRLSAEPVAQAACMPLPGCVPWLLRNSVDKHSGACQVLQNDS